MNQVINQITVKDGIQGPIEILASIKQMGICIANSDLTSTTITKMRILGMRTLLNTLEDYNNQIIIIENKLYNEESK